MGEGEGKGERWLVRKVGKYEMGDVCFLTVCSCACMCVCAYNFKFKCSNLCVCDDDICDGDPLVNIFNT